MPPRTPPGVLAALTLAAASACHATPTSRVVFPRVRAHAPEPRAFDVLAYDIAVELFPSSRSIDAECRVRFAALDEPVAEIELDLVGLRVEGVEDAHGHALAFHHARGALAIELCEPLAPDARGELAVRYGGVPERGLWFAGKRADGSGPTLVFSHGQTQGSRGWFPCVDEPDERAAVELEITAPEGWITLGPGERVASRTGAGRTVDTWRLDFEHPAYLTSLVAGELVVSEGRAGDVPLLFVAEPHLAEHVERTFGRTDEILAFLEELTGIPYPYPKYGQACVDNFPWGGMENVSATTLTPLLLSDEAAHRDQTPDHLVAHEAAHQWFGDLFTCADWAHLWLNEGFATYLTLLWIEHADGVDEFRARLREAQEAYLAQDVGAARRPTVWGRWKEPDDVFDTRAYQGGAARLHLLRTILGDDAFFAGVRAYAGESIGKSVVTDDLRRALERASGRDLSRFFAEWLRSPGFPELRVAWSWDEAAREVVLDVAQVQSTDRGTPAVFHVPVEIEVRTSGGARTHRVELDARRQRLRLRCDARPEYVRFDVHGAIPKRVQEEKAPSEWAALAGTCEDVNARREAALVLGRMAGDARTRATADPAPLVEALLARLADDASPWVRADAATALGLAGGDDAAAALRRAALEDGAARVRVAALHALRAFGPDASLVLVAEDAFASGFSYQTMAAAAGLVCAAAPERGFEFVSAGLERVTPHDELAGLLLRQLAALGDPRVPGELRRYAADPALTPTARAVAVECLAALPTERIESSRAVVPLLDADSFHLRLAAVRALVSFADPGARNALMAYYPRSRTAEERRAIEALLDVP